ncbi:hypothetical protein N7488_010857 [Penicillium malachiteum]|nr:hypothetical protein N7488_010857 [Penicillium malachiteum]
MAAGGLEVLGAIVTIIEAIELGTKVALKLSTFYREATAANESMKGLSIDVTPTCAILSDLSKVLKKNKYMKFAPESASETAAKVIAECKSVFEDILVVVERQEREAEQGLWQRAIHMLTIAFVAMTWRS